MRKWTGVAVCDKFRLMKKGQYLFIICSVLATSAAMNANALCLTKEQILKRVCARAPKLDNACKIKVGIGYFGIHDDSCIANVSASNLIPGIINAKDNTVIDESVYRDNNPEKIATSIVYRFFRKCEAELIEQSTKEFLKPEIDAWEKGQIEIAFNLRNFESILKDGFLNLHQADHSNGSTNKSERFKAECRFSGLKIQDSYDSYEKYLKEIQTILPKYAYFGYREFHKKIAPAYISQYGEVVAVLKNSVKKRALWTLGDSLNYFVLKGGDDCKKITRSFYNFTSHLGFEKVDDYYESQIWGPLGITDVDYFLVGCFGNEVEQKFFDLLKAHNKNIPTYQCQRMTKKGRQYLRKTRLMLSATDGRIVSGINVVSASFGLNISKEATNNALKAAGDFCNGKSTCNYKVSERYLGTFFPGQKKSFEIKWKCLNEKTPAEHVLNEAADVEGKILTLSCPDSD